MFDGDHINATFTEIKKQNEISTLEANLNGADPADWAVATALRAIALSIKIGVSLGMPIQMFPEIIFQVAEKLDGGKQVQ